MKILANTKTEIINKQQNSDSFLSLTDKDLRCTNLFFIYRALIPKFPKGIV